MNQIFFQFRFIILGLIILPMCLYFASIFFYIVFAALKTGGGNEVFSFMEIALNRVMPYFFETLFLAYKELLMPVAIFVTAYSFFYKANKSIKRMVFMWAVSGALISHHFIWKFLQDPSSGIDESLAPYALVIFAFAGALAAFLVHLLMGKKNTAPSLHDTFK